MAASYKGKLLFVNLSTREIQAETPDESLYRNFIGGYGIGARILYSRQKGGVDALGPENTLGLVTGILTGTPTPFGCRYTVVAKSPLTGGWGDANSGGEFGPHLRFAGYDAIFFNGISEKPVYLFIDNGKAELKEANQLWGKNTFETDDILEAEYGKTAKVVSIGPAGEKCSQVACIMTHRGDTAGRSGLGAVMGSKKLKAVVVRGDRQIPTANIEEANRLRKQGIAGMKGKFLEVFHKYGTCSHAAESAHSGDSPVKNWGGVGVIDLPDASGIDKDLITTYVESRTGCWHCAAACKGMLKAGTGDFKYPAGTHRPEYETLAAFGCICLNNNFEVIARANHICNAYGLDTISTGTIIAFATECYEQGIINKSDTDGIELTWGNHRGMLDMLEKIAKREGFGDVLADGVKKAAERIGKKAEKYAVHIGGQELGMHDPKFGFPLPAGGSRPAVYQMDATPGRHTTGFGPNNFHIYVINAAGLCAFCELHGVNPNKYMMDFMNAIMGWDVTIEELRKTGERIANMRHVFTLREGNNPLKRKIHPRIIGRPPLKEGPLAGVSSDIEADVYWNLGALDWDRVTTKPSKRKLLELGLDDVARDLWP